MAIKYEGQGTPGVLDEVQGARRYQELPQEHNIFTGLMTLGVEIKVSLRLIWCESRQTALLGMSPMSWPLMQHLGHTASRGNRREEGGEDVRQPPPPQIFPPHQHTSCHIVYKR